jgi:hypothetical protein
MPFRIDTTAGESSVGRDEETIRTYIKNQQLDQLQLKLASS